jgi:hypothetical protein
MKKFLIILNIIIWSTACIELAHAEAVMQKVCHNDAKTKKEVCKTIKTHKKIEGTPVPDAPIKKKK